MPKVSNNVSLRYKYPVKYYIPTTHVIPEIAPRIMHAQGFTNNPALEPAPMHPHKDPLNRSITENFFLINTLIAKDAITLQHIDNIVFIMTTDF